jgi:hypothetical protein
MGCLMIPAEIWNNKAKWTPVTSQMLIGMINAERAVYLRAIERELKLAAAKLEDKDSGL